MSWFDKYTTLSFPGYGVETMKKYRIYVPIETASASGERWYEVSAKSLAVAKKLYADGDCQCTHEHIEAEMLGEPEFTEITDEE